MMARRFFQIFRNFKQQRYIIIKSRVGSQSATPAARFSPSPRIAEKRLFHEFTLSSVSAYETDWAG